jgi:hypothetical protein
VGPRTSLDDVEEREVLPLPGLELRPLGRPVSTQTALTRLLFVNIWINSNGAFERDD